MATEAHIRGNKKYLAKLDHITIRMPQGSKDQIKDAADRSGKSLNAFIVEAINEKLNKNSEDVPN